MNHLKINKIVCTLAILTTFSLQGVDRFNNDYIPTEYNFQGLFAAHSDLDFYYAILNKQGTPLPGIALDPNKLIRLQPLIGDQWQDVSLKNNTVLILAPQISTRGLTKDVESILCYVVIDRKNDFITIYLYIPAGLGNKLTFNIAQFEQYMLKTGWAQMLGLLFGQNAFYAWEFGFEFYTNDADFVPRKGSKDAKEKTFFSKSPYATPMFTIDLHAKDNKYPSGNWAPAQWLAALKPVINHVLDPKLLNPKFLIDNGIVTRRAFVDADYNYVTNVLKDAGIKLPK